MVDVKTCLDNAQEKMDMAVMYLEEALAQCSCFIHSGCSQYHHQTVGQKYVPCHRKSHYRL